MKQDYLNICSGVDRGQAYTFEATIATLLIVVGILFIVPGLTTPISQANLAEAQLENEVDKEINHMLDMHTQNGHLKSLILNYESGQWEISHPSSVSTGEQYAVGPNETIARTGAEEGDHRHFFSAAPGPVGKSIEDIKNKHDVWIEIYLYPVEGTSTTNEDHDRIEFLGDSVGDSVLTRQSTTIMLYESDRLRSPPEAHSLYASSSLASKGDGQELSEIDDSDSDEFVIGESTDNSDNNVYNKVRVEVVVYEEQER